MKKNALIVGASGVIGHAVARHLLSQSDWNVTGMSRRAAPFFMADIPWISADIDSPESLKSVAGQLAGITHVFYAAYVPNSDLAQEAQINGRMLRHLLDVLESAKAPLERVVLYQGGKVYGLHLGPVKTPMRETDPRHMPPNFYYDLEDTLVEASQRSGWSYTLLRPDLVFGAIPGQPLNLAMAIGAYATFCREYRVPFRFPGSAKAHSRLVQATDADLLARVSLWAATTSKAANETYNVTNGDYFRWENLWPWLAEQLGLQVGPPMGIRLVNHMHDKGEAWHRLAQQHKLVVPEYDKAVGWGFADFIFHTEHDVVSDLTKLRQHGCHEILRTDDALVATLRQLQDARIVPPLF
ncbi:TPA: SDR family oxidoreductase [Pseudomonas aeruginosa]|nr:SDR family oxidoreductase [Pseudomonas aeruginosa]